MPKVKVGGRTVHYPYSEEGIAAAKKAKEAGKMKAKKGGRRK